MIFLQILCEKVYWLSFYLFAEFHKLTKFDQILILEAPVTMLNNKVMNVGANHDKP